MTDKIKITVKAIKAMPDAYDISLAKTLKQLYPDIFKGRLDTVRRYIGVIRDEFKLPRSGIDHTQLYKDIANYRAKYPEATMSSLALRIHKKHPHLKVGTIKSYIYEKNHYGTEYSSRDSRASVKASSN